MLTFGSLFAGIGGFDLGFERAGFKCKWQVEIDDYATRILERHWPDVHRERDIRQCGRHNLERVDCIIGGWPCQDISYAGKGAGLEGARSGLFFEAVRLVCELRPRAVVLENVAGLLTRGLDRVLGTLAEVGFDAEWHCIPAAAVGAPHIRDRVFIIAIHSNTQDGNARQLDERNAERSGKGNPQKRQRLRDKFSGLGSIAANANGERWNEMEQENERRAESEGAVGSIDERAGRIRKSDWWATEPAVGRVANGVPSRVDRLRCLGNAIVPQVAEVVAKMAMERLQGVEDV